MTKRWEFTAGGRLVGRLEELGIRFFGVDEARRISGKSYRATVMMLQRLMQAGRVVRLNRGRYGLVGRDGQGLNPLVLGRGLAGGIDYYIGYGSALELHGMLPAGTMGKRVVVVLPKERRLKPRKRMGVVFLFVRDAWEESRIRRPQPRPAQWKVMEMEASPGEKILVSDPEWTILCGLGRPELCGGIETLKAVLANRGEGLDLEKLMRYTSYMRNRTAVRRLGFLMDELGLHTELTRLRLSLWVRGTYGRLEPNQTGKDGWLNRTWRLVVNVDSVSEWGTSR